MSLLKIGIAALAAAVLVTGCDRAVTRIFSPYENDSRNVKRIGTAVATVAVIFGQLTMSMLIDNFGWLGNPAIPFSPSRLGAVICLGIALYFIYSSSKIYSARD